MRNYRAIFRVSYLLALLAVGVYVSLRHPHPIIVIVPLVITFGFALGALYLYERRRRW